VRGWRVRVHGIAVHGMMVHGVVCLGACLQASTSSAALGISARPDAIKPTLAVCRQHCCSPPWEPPCHAANVPPVRVCHRGGGRVGDAVQLWAYPEGVDQETPSDPEGQPCCFSGRITCIRLNMSLADYAADGNCCGGAVLGGPQFSELFGAGDLRSQDMVTAGAAYLAFWPRELIQGLPRPGCCFA
jgi:hypothetical protein